MTEASREQALTIATGRTVGGMLRAGAARHPDRAFVVFEDRDGEVETFSWAQMLERSLAIAARLSDLGVTSGDRIHLHLPNRPEFLATWFAAAHLGAAIVPTNTASSVEEVAYILEHSNAVLSVTDSEGRSDVDGARAAAGRQTAVLGCEDDGLLALPSANVSEAPVEHGDDLAVLYTSGTTSRPKGVRLTHANFVWVGEAVAAGVRLSPADRVLTVLPLFHANALCYTTMSALNVGATSVLLARFSARRFLGQAAEHGATVGSLFSAPIRMILAQEDPKARLRDHSLRVVMFAQNLTPAELERWDASVGAPLLQLYGMTETVAPPTMNPIDGERRHETIGRVTQAYRCRVVRDDGAPAAIGEPGELLVHGVPGVSLMRGYLDDPDATDRAIEDGWLRTGDVVRADADGYLTFVDRAKDMIKRGGENVAAGEVEDVLKAHPAVADAAVVGVPDPIWEEEVVGVVVLAPGADADLDELRNWCADRLARFRVPTRLELRDDLPRTPVGKIQKHLLRGELLEGASSG